MIANKLDIDSKNSPYLKFAMFLCKQDSSKAIQI